MPRPWSYHPAVNLLPVWLFVAIPPLLLDADASIDALDAAGDPLRAAEARLLSGRPRNAMKTLDLLPEIGTGTRAARILRIRLDATVDAGDGDGAEPLGAALAAHPGWQSHAARQLDIARMIAVKRSGPRWGAVVYALAAAILMLGGARELLRIRRETVVLALAIAAAMALVSGASGTLGPVFGLIFVAMLALAHAAVATVRRGEPGPRGRLLIAVLMLLGTAGVAIAAVSELGVSRLLRELTVGVYG